MKTFIAVFCLSLLMVCGVRAQDIIHTTDGTQIRAKVIEIRAETVTYKLFERLDGPLYVIAKREIYKIVYENGMEEVFGNRVEYGDEEPAVPYRQVSQQPARGKYQHGNYFALAVGYGNSYGGIGIRLQGRFGDVIGGGVHAGVGYFPAFSFAEGSSGSFKGAVLVSAGAKFFMYKALYLNLQYGTFGYAEKSEFFYQYSYYNSYYYNYKKSGLLYGPSLLIGADMIFGKHFGFNAAGGVSHNQNKDFREYEWWPALDIAFLVRF